MQPFDSSEARCTILVAIFYSPLIYDEYNLW